jgi:hypothetical protein
MGFGAPFKNADGSWYIHCNPQSQSAGRDCSGLKTLLQAGSHSVDALTSSESSAISHDKS